MSLVTKSNCQNICSSLYVKLTICPFLLQPLNVPAVVRGAQAQGHPGVLHGPGAALLPVQQPLLRQPVLLRPDHLLHVHADQAPHDRNHVPGQQISCYVQQRSFVIINRPGRILDEKNI